MFIKHVKDISYNIMKNVAAIENADTATSLFRLENFNLLQPLLSKIREKPPRRPLNRKGASIKYVRKIFGFLDPLPPCPHFVRLFVCKIGRFLDPLPPIRADVLNGNPPTST